LCAAGVAAGEHPLGRRGRDRGDRRVRRVDDERRDREARTSCHQARKGEAGGNVCELREQFVLQVENFQRLVVVWKEPPGFLKERLRLRARDQDTGSDGEGQAPELPLPGDVGNRLARGTTAQKHVVATDLFERRFSADGVKHHKPSPEAYGYAQKELGVESSQLCLIACHTWDTLGAVAAGWEAALIKRVGNDVLGVGPQPQIVGNDLDDVANQLIARHKGAMAAR